MRKVYHTPQAYQPRRYKQFPEPQPDHKWCVDCEQEKHVDAFHKMQGGYRPQCKDCRRKRDKARSEPVQLPLFVLSKICTKCDKAKDFEEFDLDQNGSYGRFSQCKECRSEYNRQFRIENLEEVRAQAHIKNAKPETKAQRMKRHRERSATDPQYLESRQRWRRTYYLNHTEEAKDFYPRRRARILNATVGEVDYTRILERNGYHCYLCNQPIHPDAKPGSSASLSFDHVIPLHPRPGEPQGSHSEENILPAHVACNVRKSNRSLETLTDFDRRGP